MMKKFTKEHELLSAYIDGELSPAEREELEQRIQSSLGLRKQFEDLQKLKKLTSASYKKIPESPYFETRLFAEIDSQSPGYIKFSKWSPAIGLALLTVAIMVFLNFNPDIIKNLVEEQKSNIAGFYKENLQPLLFTSDINNEDIFNFAMYKQLPLDKQNNQYLQLGYDQQGNEYVEIKNMDINKNEDNFEKFVMALELNQIQRKQIDSIIERYAEELGNQVLVNDNKTVAINSNLWNYQKAIQSDLFAFAENSNRNEFRKFVPSSVSLVRNPQMVEAVKNIRTSKNKNYIFLTPDSIFSEPLEFDLEKFKSELKELEKNLERQNSKLQKVQVRLNYDSTWKDLNGKHSWHSNYNIYVDSNICRVNIPHLNLPDFQIPDFDSLVGAFDSVASNFKFYSKYIPKIEYFDNKLNFHFNNDSSNSHIGIQSFSIDMDSIMQAQSELMDSLSRLNWNYHYPFNDSLVMKGFPNFKNFFKYFGEENNMKEQMEELKKELQNFREEMKDWREELKQKNDSKQKKLYD